MQRCPKVLILLKPIPLLIWQQIPKRYSPSCDSTLKF